ncbi:uncharacterized protein [Macrobrachium rosenbergii]|uniref:uncharacterized protein n=1 Tax=Macrobrachium rosenbergii TaxID=79674 RepID=UPI0034D498AB
MSTNKLQPQEVGLVVPTDSSCRARPPAPPIAPVFATILSSGSGSSVANCQKNAGCILGLPGLASLGISKAPLLPFFLGRRRRRRHSPNLTSQIESFKKPTDLYHLFPSYINQGSFKNLGQQHSLLNSTFVNQIEQQRPSGMAELGLQQPFSANLNTESQNKLPDALLSDTALLSSNNLLGISNYPTPLLDFIFQNMSTNNFQPQEVGLRVPQIQAAEPVGPFNPTDPYIPALDSPILGDPIAANPINLLAGPPAPPIAPVFATILSSGSEQQRPSAMAELGLQQPFSANLNTESQNKLPDALLSDTALLSSTNLPGISNYPTPLLDFIFQNMSTNNFQPQEVGLRVPQIQAAEPVGPFNPTDPYIPALDSPTLGIPLLQTL